MNEWIPVPRTAKGKLVRAALAEFGVRGFANVGVAEIAAAADVTTGSLYHHFGSKSGLYNLVRTDVERRLLDRLEGAWDASPELDRAIAVGFDFVVRAGFARMLGEPHPERADDPVEAFFAKHADRDGLPIGRLVAAAWQAALLADDPLAARDALLSLMRGRMGTAGTGIACALPVRSRS